MSGCVLWSQARSRSRRRAHRVDIPCGDLHGSLRTHRGPCSLRITRAPDCRYVINRSVNSREVDESLLHVRVRQLHANPMPHVDALKTMHQSAFHGRIKKADPGAFGRCTRDNGIEPFPDSRFQQQCRCRFPDLPFHLLGCILLFRAVLCQRLQIIVAIGGGLLRPVQPSATVA